MKSYKFKAILIAAIVALSSAAVFANTEEDNRQYRRSSLCSILVSRTDQKLHDKIQEMFLDIPVPNQYNDHNLSVRIVSVDKKGNYASDIDSWLEQNQIASRLVGKWFDRNIFDGTCSMDLVKYRGLYNATEYEKEIASRSTRGQAMLEDAGEELIGNTFVIVNEAHYIDNAQRAKNVGAFLRILGAVAGAVTGIDAVSDLGNSLGAMAETFKGFRVKMHTRLYQLVWDEESAATFYQDMYSENPDELKRSNFENGRHKFKLKYIGQCESSGSKNSFLGISEEHPEIMIKKACIRAIDDNVRDLQRDYEVFRVKSPITKISGKQVFVPVGLKEGVNAKSEYEVLEEEVKNGKTSYKRIGVIVPDANYIWDNRYMAKEEGAPGAELNYTTFRVKSGKTPTLGNFVRQIK